MTIDDKEALLNEVMTRSVAESIDPDGVFLDKLRRKIRGEYDRDIVVKFGADPTRPDIHIGHAVILRKLRQMQELGCKVVFLVGDFTAQIGDPTGKSKVRPEIDQRAVEKNMKTYLEQVGKILLTDSEHFSWIRNSHWFTGVADILVPDSVRMEIALQDASGSATTIRVAPNSFVGKALFYERNNMQITHLKRKEVLSVTLRGLLWTLRHITHGRLIARDMFQERLRKGGELYIHEMLYPVLQGIDSNILHNLYGSCDLEIGGTDQTFNMLMGRDVMKINGQEPQSVMCIELLEGTDGSEKMSKSMDNYIGITEDPDVMFGKIMSIPDDMIIRYYTLCTYSPEGVIGEIERGIKKGSVNPRDAKIRLAHEIVSIYHGEQKAKDAERRWIKTFSKKEVPEVTRTLSLKKDETLMDALVREGYLKSRSEFRRLVASGGVRECGNGMCKISDSDYVPADGAIVKIGKKTFIRIKRSDT